MQARPHHAAVLGVVALLCGCGGSDRPVGDFDAGGATVDGGSTVDAARADGGGAPGVDAGERDAGPCSAASAQCPTPPAGFMRCGGGPIDPSAAHAACDAVNPASDLGTGIMKACAAFTIVEARYELWCGVDAVYLWASFDMLESSEVTSCMFGTVTRNQLSWNPNDGNSSLYATIVTVGAGRRGGMFTDGLAPYTGSPRTTLTSTWMGSVAVDGRFDLPAGVTGGTGTVYYTMGQTDCGGVPTADGFRIVLAVPITWGG